jgi:hypothetical protein
VEVAEVVHPAQQVQEASAAVVLVERSQGTHRVCPSRAVAAAVRVLIAPFLPEQAAAA